VGDALGVGETAAVGETSTVGVGVAASTPKRNWPPASIWKWTDCRALNDASALERILRGSVKGADVQPAMSATTANMPAAVLAIDFRRDT